jgi:uncharacterized membrane protein
MAKNMDLTTKVKKPLFRIILVSLIMHSLCCVMPVICFLIGLTTVGHFMEIFHEFEWIFIILNVVAIAAGFYMYYLHNYSGCNHRHCHPSKKPFWIISGISLSLLVVPHIYHHIFG